MAMVNKLRWGVLGCSRFARRRSIPAMLRCPSVDLVACASRQPEQAEAFQSQFGVRKAYGYDELLSDPEIDAIHITLPNSLHARWLVRALEMGKHVLCEKPFTTELADAETVASVAARTGLSVMEGFMWRFHPQHREAMRIIDDGVIGAVRLVRASFSYQIDEANVRLDKYLGGGSVFDVGCYGVASARYYFRSEPTRVYALGRQHADYGVDFGMAGMLEFPGGVALIDCAFDQPFRTDLEIVGEKGSIRFARPWQPDEEAAITVATADGVTETVLPAANHYMGQFEHFSRAILDGVPTAFGADDAVKQMKVVAAIFASMNSRLPQSV